MGKACTNWHLCYTPRNSICCCWGPFCHQKPVISSFLTLSGYVLLSCNFCLLARAPDFAKTALALLPSAWAPVFPVASSASPGDSRSLLTKVVVFCHSSHSSAAGPGLWRGGDARGAWGAGVLPTLAVAAAAHGLCTSAICKTCLQKVMDVPVIGVGQAWCMVTALRSESAVTSVQTHSCTVQIV